MKEKRITGLYDCYGRPIPPTAKGVFALPLEKGLLSAQIELNYLSADDPNSIWLSQSIAAGQRLLELIKFRR